jgi:hypothetical protein
MNNFKYNKLQKWKAYYLITIYIIKNNND